MIACLLVFGVLVCLCHLAAKEIQYLKEIINDE